MLKIRRPLGRLIFNMGIAIPGKTVFLIETPPWWHMWQRNGIDIPTLPVTNTRSPLVWHCHSEGFLRIPNLMCNYLKPHFSGKTISDCTCWGKLMGNSLGIHHVNIYITSVETKTFMRWIAYAYGIGGVVKQVANILRDIARGFALKPESYCHIWFSLWNILTEWNVGSCENVLMVR